MTEPKVQQFEWRPTGMAEVSTMPTHAHWVRYSDYEALEARVEELKAEKEALRKTAESLNECADREVVRKEAAWAECRELEARVEELEGNREKDITIPTLHAENHRLIEENKRWRELAVPVATLLDDGIVWYPSMETTLNEEDKHTRDLVGRFCAEFSELADKEEGPSDDD